MGYAYLCLEIGLLLLVSFFSLFSFNFFNFCCFKFHRYCIVFQLLPVCRVSGDQPLLEAADFVTSFKLLHATDARAAMLNGDIFNLFTCYWTLQINPPFANVGSLAPAYMRILGPTSTETMNSMSFL